MRVNEIMLELAEELVDPAEAVLDDQVEELMDNTDDIMLGISDDDDEVINFIANGNRITNSDPVDFTDSDVDDVVFDDVEEE